MGINDTGRSTREPAGGLSGVPSSRRRLLGWLWGVLGIAALGELVWVTTSFLRPRGRKAVVESIFVAGSVDDFEPGSVTPFPAGRFYLVRLEDGGFLALDRSCTHLGCTVPWDADEARFACPCQSAPIECCWKIQRWTSRPSSRCRSCPAASPVESTSSSRSTRIPTLPGPGGEAALKPITSCAADAGDCGRNWSSVESDRAGPIAHPRSTRRRPAAAP